MITVEREVVTGAPLSRVAAYLSDFTNTADWDPHTKECQRLHSGPLQVGANYRNVQDRLVPNGAATSYPAASTRLEHGGEGGTA